MCNIGVLNAFWGHLAKKQRENKETKQLKTKQAKKNEMNKQRVLEVYMPLRPNQNHTSFYKVVQTKP